VSSTAADRPGAATGRGRAVVVAERAGDAGAHLMVAAYVVPARAAALRAEVSAMLDADGLWCGPGAVSGRSRDGLVVAVISGGVGAVVVDAAGFDDATQARAACLRAVIADADEAEVDPVLVVRDDACAARDEATAGELARLALRCGARTPTRAPSR